MYLCYVPKFTGPHKLIPMADSFTEFTWSELLEYERNEVQTLGYMG